MSSPDTEHGGRLALSSLTALGIVYGDIGTSPLYAFRESLRGEGRFLPADPVNILGILSLILWSLVIVISIKYLGYVLRADNEGEGGILALLALLGPWRGRMRRRRRLIAVMGIFGAALLYGDGAITPAISVLSAVEGLEVAAPSLGPWVIALSVAILLGLFLFQRHGTAGIGRYFGPVMLVWFGTLAALGVRGILLEPDVVRAVDPTWALRFFLVHRWAGMLALGARLPRRHGRRGPLRRHGPLRQTAHPPGLVLAGPARPAAELLRPGSAAPRRAGGGPPALLPPGARRAALAAARSSPPSPR